MSSKKDQNILLIEDEESLILLYSTLLEKYYNVSNEKNKEDAKKRIEAGNIDLILLDIIIPPKHKDIIDYSKRTGFELLKELKENKDYNNIKVIVLTNLESQEDRNTAMDLGANDYIVKSDVIPKIILEKVQKLLE
ncbi:response regulator [Patescibacteria group bacterium]|nr:response regulator [Patescibacteria group bacterium]MBU1963259.1 response regulator [Patescibacteria group bacterium]